MPHQQKTVIDQAIEDGIGEIVKRHRKFEGRESVIRNYIDKGALQKHQMGLISYAKQNLNMNQNQLTNYLLEGLTKYIANGGGLEDKGKEIILKKSLEDKAKKPFGFISQWRLLGEDYIGRAVQFARNLEGYAANGNMGNMPPELLESARNLKGLGWSDVIFDEMRYNGLMTKGEYNSTKKQVVKAAEREVEKIRGYATPGKIAPLILGILGLIVLIINSGMTGAVIGTPAKFAGGFLGTILIIFSCVLLLISSKKR